MQRRVAAIYLVFFAVLGASAFSVHALAEQPDITVPNSEEFDSGDTAIPNGELYVDGDEFTVGGTTYTVTLTMEEASGGGGHGGGGGGMVPAGALTYTDTSVEQTATWEDGSTITYQQDDYSVALDADAATATLTETFDVPTLLAEDPEVFNETVTQDGTEYVTYRENNTNVPLSEYLPEPQTETFSEGDTVEYQNTTTTLSTVGESEATLTWTVTEEAEISLEEGSNVTLADNTSYFPHIKGHSEEDLSVVIAPAESDYAAYQAGLDKQEYYHERQNGLWGIMYISGIAVVLITSLAYMPVRG